MSDPGERDPYSGESDRATREREWAELQQELLREEVQRRQEFRELFETHEKVIAEKVRQLRIERGWSQGELARRMEELGWPVHQTTVAKLEAAKRPIRAAEVYALALVFGLPMQALWYLPVPGEPWSIERMRETLKALDDEIADTKRSLQKIISIYADLKSERLRLAAVMDEAAKSGAEAAAYDFHLDTDALRGLADMLSESQRLAAKGVSLSEARRVRRAEDAREGGS